MKTHVFLRLLLLALALGGCLPAPAPDRPTGGIQDDEYREAFLDLNDEVGLQVELALASTENDSLAAIQVAQWLESNAEIAEYTALAGSIEYTNIEGYLAAVYWTPTDSPAVASRALPLTPTPASQTQKPTIPTQPNLSKQRLLPSTSTLDADCGLPDGTCGCLSNKKVLHFEPFYFDWGNTASMLTSVDLIRNAGLGMQPESYLDADATVEVLERLHEFGLILIHTHGGPSGFASGVQANPGWGHYWDLYDQGLLYPSKIEETSRPGRYWCVRTSFINALAEDFAGSVICNVACRTLDTDNVACAFLQKGASAYIGFRGIHRPHLGSRLGNDFVRSFVNERKTVTEAFDESWEYVGFFNDYRMRSRSNVKLCISDGAWNAEEPNPYAWFQSAIGDNNLLAMDILGHAYHYTDGAGTLDGVWDSLGMVIDSYPPYPTGPGDVWVPVPVVTAFDASSNGNAWALVGRSGFDTLDIDSISTCEFWRGSGSSWNLVTHTEDTTILYPEAFEAAGDGELWAIYSTHIRRYSYSQSTTIPLALGEGTQASFRGADNGWIVGGNGEVYHYDGASLQRESRFSGGMAATPLVSALTCGGVCLHRSPMDYDLNGSIFHTFDGEVWDQVTLPFYEGTVQQLGGATPSELWWVRFAIPEGGIYLEHWDGDTITVQANLGTETPIFGLDMRSTDAGWGFGFGSPNLKFE